jgi:hypothetical protein
LEKRQTLAPELQSFEAQTKIKIWQMGGQIALGGNEEQVSFRG